jgi:hypothetical protein
MLQANDFAVFVTGRWYRPMLQADGFVVLFMNEFKNLTNVVIIKSRYTHSQIKLFSLYDFFL